MIHGARPAGAFMRGIVLNTVTRRSWCRRRRLKEKHADRSEEPVRDLETGAVV